MIGFRFGQFRYFSGSTVASLRVNWLMLGVNGGLQVCTLGKEELSKMPAEKNAIAIRRCGGPGAHDPI